MRKLFFVLVCMIAAGAVFASTCETRVDKKWNRTTQERVDTCLQEEQVVEAATPKTAVIVSDVASVQYPKAKAKNKKPVANTTHKKYTEQEAYNELIDDKYPKFKNEFLPLQSTELAQETALEALQAQRAAAEQPVVKKTKKSGKKPASKVVVSTTTKTVEIVQEPAPQPTETPAAEIQQAQALENNLTAPVLGTNEQFLDDSVLGPDDFGYNSTDPAFQQ